MRKLLAIVGGASAIVLVFAMAFGWAGVSFDIKEESNGVVAVTSLLTDDGDDGDVDTNSPDTDSPDSSDPDTDTDPGTDSPIPDDTDSVSGSDS